MIVDIKNKDLTQVFLLYSVENGQMGTASFGSVLPLPPSMNVPIGWRRVVLRKNKKNVFLLAHLFKGPCVIASMQDSSNYVLLIQISRGPISVQSFNPFSFASASRV
jgi:hypothetical protein